LAQRLNVFGGFRIRTDGNGSEWLKPVEEPVAGLLVRRASILGAEGLNGGSSARKAARLCPRVQRASSING